ncbi:MAG: hypothetical protein WD708_01160, partial [Kiritimatiellia bacterium]
LRKQNQDDLREQVAVLTAEPVEQQKTDLFLQPLNQGIHERLDRLGYDQVWFAASDWKGKAKAFHKMIRTRGFRGLVCCPYLPVEILDAGDWRDVAVVNAGYLHDQNRMHQAIPDQFHNLYLLLESLREKGYHRIGFLTTWPIDERVKHRWLSAFLGFQFRGTIGDVPPLIRVDGGVTKKNFQDWCGCHKPDAVITTRYEPMTWTAERGFPGPGPEDLYCPGVSSPHGPFQGIDEQVALVAAAAVDLVTSQMNWNECGLPETPKTILIPGKLLTKKA